MDAEKIAEYCLGATALAAVALTIMFWGSWFLIIGVWVLAFPFAMFLGLVSGFVHRALNGPVMVQEPLLWLDDVSALVLEVSPETIGTFQDAKIHEWIILKRPDNGEPIRLGYNRTVDMERDTSFEPPDEKWFCVLPPGIMYTEPENVSA